MKPDGKPILLHPRSVKSNFPSVTVVHRDLYEEQIVLGPSIGLIDLDNAALGPAELDVGNLELRRGRDLSATVQALLGAYGVDSLDPLLLEHALPKLLQ